MPIDPQTLQSISNPMGGLSNIGAMYAQGEQMKQNKELMEMKQQEQMLAMADVGSRITGAYASAMINWKRENPNATNEEFEAVQLEQWNQLDPAHRQFVPKEFQTLQQLKTGKERSDQIQAYLGRGKGTEGSEFERLEEKVNSGTASQAERKRHSVLAGTGMRLGEEARLDEKKTDRTHKEEKALRKEYTEGSEHFRGMSNTIDSAFAAMESGDTKLSETLLNQVMSQVQDTNVRAFQMYGEFDKEFGNLAQRIQGQISRFILGTRTERETNEIKSVLKRFKDSYVDPASKKLRDRYRVIAIDQGKDPLVVVPPDSPEDIIQSDFLTKKQKYEAMKKYYPKWKP